MYIRTHKVQWHLDLLRGVETPITQEWSYLLIQLLLLLYYYYYYYCYEYYYYYYYYY